MVIHAYNEHRVMAALLVVSMKFWFDIIRTNKFYAYVSGLTVKELNFLEELILLYLDWDLGLTNLERHAIRNICLNAYQVNNNNFVLHTP